MEVTDKYVEEYRTIYRKHFGVDIDPQTARSAATKLLELVQILYEPTGSGRDRGLIDSFQTRPYPHANRRKMKDENEGGDVREPGSHA
jgi:hypothetical protein